MIKYSESLPYGLEIISDSVVKKTAECSLIESYIQCQRIINHFIKNPDPLVVPVYDCQPLGLVGDKWYSYSYTMKRLGILSEEEKRLISLCVSFDSTRKSYLTRKPELIKEFELAKEALPTMYSFMSEVLSQSRYKDLHPGNFLKDEFDDYKIIDLEGFLVYPVDKDIIWIKDET